MKDLMKLDLYELLNIKLTATESEIKKAYRKKALTCHPDKNPDDPKADEDFKQLSKAVEILTNVITRADYDKLLRQRKAARSKTVYIVTNKAQRKNSRKKEETKEKKQCNESKEKKKKHCFHSNAHKRSYPFCFSSFAKEYGYFHSRKGCPYKKDTEKTVPTWPPSASKTRMNNRNAYRRYMHFDREKTFPTWPPTSPASDSEINSDSEKKANSSSNFNSPLIRPATFVAPSSAEFQNLWQGSNKTFSPLVKPGSSKTFSPLVKPAKFVAPSNSKNSDGFHSTHQKGFSPILKPATFVAPSKS